MTTDKFDRLLEHVGEKLSDIGRAQARFGGLVADSNDETARNLAMVRQLGKDIAACKLREQELRAAGKATEAAEVARFIERLTKARTRLGG